MLIVVSISALSLWEVLYYRSPSRNVPVSTWFSSAVLRVELKLRIDKSEHEWHRNYVIVTSRTRPSCLHSPHAPHFTHTSHFSDFQNLLIDRVYDIRRMSYRSTEYLVLQYDLLQFMFMSEVVVDLNRRLRHLKPLQVLGVLYV